MSPPARCLSVCVLVCAVRLSFSTSSIECKGQHQDAHTWGSSPLKLSSGQLDPLDPQYVSMHIRLRPEDLTINHRAKICILSSAGSRNITIIKKYHDSKTITWKIKKSGRADSRRGSCHMKNNLTMWELQYKFVAEAGESVSAEFRGSTIYTENYIVPDPVPQFHLSVDPGSRTINVTVKPGASVHTMLCYRINTDLCEVFSPRITINPAVSLSATLNASYVLPCVCVQVFYTHTDAKRVTECPFTNISLEGGDVWLSSEVKLRKHSVVAWSSPCPSSSMKPSAALCWRNDAGLCTPILNSSLQMIDSSLSYNISTLDKHAQMCLQFSFENNHHVHCPFESDESTWEARVGAGWQSMSVHLTSTTPATFSAQLCVRRHSGCRPIGHAYSGRTDRATAELQLNVPVHTIAEKPCVQVWQSEPAQLGKRILCPEYTHWRSGMAAVAALGIGVTLALLAFLVYKVTKSGTTGWLSIHKPVLLVCSSGKPAHVSAVCALASILQGELCAAVRMALWSQSSERQPGAGAGAGGPAPGNGVADLGPLPWLYGEWDAVQRGRGKVLVVWSPEAKKVFERTREQKAEVERRKREGTRKGGAKRGKVMDLDSEEEDLKLKERTLTYGTEKATLLEEDEMVAETTNEGSSITGPVLRATLTRLQGALQESGRSHPVVLISLRGLGHNRDIPNELRGVPRYCLPGDFRGLIQELGGIASGTKEDLGCNCWPRLLSKILSLWLARRLSHQLKTSLP